MNEAEPLIAPDTDREEDADAEGVGRPVARFIHEHPAAVIAAGLAVGAVAAALLPKRNREYVATKSSALADAVSATGLMLYREAIERAEAAGGGIRGIAERIGDAAASISDDTKTPAEPDKGRLGIADGITAILRDLLGRTRN